MSGCGASRTPSATVNPQLAEEVQEAEVEPEVEPERPEPGPEVIERFEIGASLFRSRQYQDAEQPLQEACDAFFGPGCIFYAACLEELGRPEEAAEVMQRGCFDQDLIDVCRNIGSETRDDDDRALAAYRHACEIDPAGGCLSLGQFLEDRLARSEEAIEPYRRACDAGEGYACVELAGFAEGDAEIETLYRRGCQQGANAQSCSLLGVLLEEDERTEEANEAYQRACTLSPNNFPCPGEAW